MGLFDIYQGSNNNNNYYKNFDSLDNYDKQENKISLFENYNNNDNKNNMLKEQKDLPFYKKENIEENNKSLTENYKKEMFFEENNIASILNVRGKNYQELSIIDKMRGIQANRLNLDTDNLSISEIYADEKLDNRTMNGLYNVTLADTYKDKRLFNAYHGLYTDGFLIEIEDTQDMGTVQKTYSELETDNPFFTENFTEKKIKTNYSELLFDKKNDVDIFEKNDENNNNNIDNKKNINDIKPLKKNNNFKFNKYAYNINNIKIDVNKENSNLEYEYENEDSSLVSSLTNFSFDEKKLFKQNENSLTSLYLKDSANPIKSFYEKENNLVKIYKNKSSNFKSSQTISSASQFQNSWNNKNLKEKPSPNNATKNKLLKKEKTNKNNITENISLFKNPNNNNFVFNKEESDKISNLDKSSTLNNPFFNDSKKIDFQEKIQKEKEKNKKILKKIFKDTANKIELLSKSQLQEILNELKIKQQRAKQNKMVLKYLKFETKIKAIENYINSLKNF